MNSGTFQLDVGSVAESTSHEDFFVSVTFHLKSAQSALNKHKESTNAQLRSLEAVCTKTLAQVSTLQEENSQLLAKLDGTDLPFENKEFQRLTQSHDVGVQIDSSPISEYPDHHKGLLGETGGSVSNVSEEIDLVPQPPPRRQQSKVSEPPGTPPFIVRPNLLHSVESMESTEVSTFGQHLQPGSIPESFANSDDSGDYRIISSSDARELKAALRANKDMDASKVLQDIVPTSHSELKKQVTIEVKKSSLFVPPDSISESPRKGFGDALRESFHGLFDRRSTHSAASSGKSNNDVLGGVGPKTVFADAAAMKEKVRQAIGKPEYNVSDYYWENGYFQWLASHPHFEQFTLFVIFVNAIWIAYDADANDSAVLSQAKPQFQIAEHSFCAFFTFEWIVRFMAFKFKRNCLYDFWFMLDSFMVSVMILEVWFVNIILTLVMDPSADSGFGQATSLKLLRLFRLTRMARIARLLNQMPELMILIKGMAVASRSVCFTLSLLGIIIYLFSILFRQLTDGSRVGEKYFATIPDAMLSLLLRGTLPDVADLVYDVSEDSPFYGIFLLVFILFASLTVMNMLVGVLCEVVTCVSSVEKETLVVNFVQTQLSKFLADTMGRSLDVPMSKSQFLELLGTPQAARTLHEVGVDVLGLMEISDFLFKEEKMLSFPEFMGLVLELRGTNNATVKHIVDLQKFVHNELRKTNYELEKHVAAMLDPGGKSRAYESTRSMDMRARSTIGTQGTGTFTGTHTPDPWESGGVIGISPGRRLNSISARPGKQPLSQGMGRVTKRR